MDPRDNIFWIIGIALLIGSLGSLFMVFTL